MYLGLIGAGIGPLHATWMLVFEKYVPMTERLFGLAYLGRSARDLVQPWLFGQFMDSHPLLLIFVGAGGSTLSLLFYLALHLVGYRFHSERAEQQSLSMKANP